MYPTEVAQAQRKPSVWSFRWIVCQFFMRPKKMNWSVYFWSPIEPPRGRERKRTRKFHYCHRDPNTAWYLRPWMDFISRLPILQNDRTGHRCKFHWDIIYHYIPLRVRVDFQSVSNLQYSLKTNRDDLKILMLTSWCVVDRVHNRKPVEDLSPSSNTKTKTSPEKKKCILYHHKNVIFIAKFLTSRYCKNETDR